jgi:hypothetical protein
MKLFAEGYGPYDDKFRLEAVTVAKQLGFKKSAEKMNCSEASVRVWTKILAQGTVNVTLSRD